MDAQTIFINACITILSTGMLILSLISYLKSKNQNLLFVLSAFLIFLTKGILLSLGLFFTQIALIAQNSLFGAFDVAILTLLFISTLKRKKYD
jgi:hypothetical protein